MRNSAHYDLYQLRQLTESIFCMRQELGELNKKSLEYEAYVKLYEDLWRERDELESKIINMCNNSIEDKVIISLD